MTRIQLRKLIKEVVATTNTGIEITNVERKMTDLNTFLQTQGLNVFNVQDIIAMENLVKTLTKIVKANLNIRMR